MPPKGKAKQKKNNNKVKAGKSDEQVESEAPPKPDAAALKKAEEEKEALLMLQRAEKRREIEAAVEAAKAKAAAEEAKANLPPEETTIIGIDLGTTYSCVAVWRHGQVEVLPNSDGARTTPSFVAFSEDGERLVGAGAKQQAARNSERTFYNVKRLIGSSYATCEDEIARVPYTVENDEKSGKPLLKCTYGDKTQSFAPEEVSAMVLEKMKATAEAALGHPVKKAVITVPAYFNDAQRRSTQTAGRIAGLEVERIINEPTAAALAYGLDKQEGGEANVLVFDLGGGTFDVSLLNISDGVFKVLATSGDTHLGGEDFDATMQAHLREIFKQNHGGKDLFQDNPRALRQLRNQCERAKCMLSVAPTAEIEIDVKGEELTYKITRATFEKLNEKLFERCLVAVKRVLEDAKMTTADVDEVVLVGGSTRIPKVQQLLQDFFDGKRLCKSVHPDEAVAYGAAVQGAVLSGVHDQKIHALILADVTPLTLGVETEGRVMSKVVPRNTTLPCRKTREFTTTEDYETELDILIFEGERTCTDGNHKLGEFRIAGVERAKRGIPKVNVTFDVNVNGMLTVTARDVNTGAKANISIQNDPGRYADEEIERMVQEADAMREEDKRRAAEAEAAFAAEHGEEYVEHDFE